MPPNPNVSLRSAGEHRIDQALRAARNELAATQGDLETTRKRLGLSESAQALAGGEPDKQSRRPLLALRDDIEVLQARIAGLESRLHDAASTTIQARQALAVAWRDWQNTQATTFTDAVYKPAVAAFLDALRLTAVVATALGNHRLHAITRRVYLPAASDPFRDMANPKRMNWREHPDAAALYDRLVAFRMEVTKHIEGITEPEANDDAA